MKLLIVDDNPVYLLNAKKSAIARGYEADFACDLEDALELIETTRYDGVITDMGFCERGIAFSLSDRSLDENFLHTFGDDGKDESGNRLYKFSEVLADDAIHAQFARAVSKSTDACKPVKFGWQEYQRRKLWPVKDDAVRARLAEASTTPATLDEVLRCTDSEELLPSFEYHRATLRSKIEEYAYSADDIIGNTGPAMGYFVIKAAQEKGIPVTVVTSRSHGDHCIPALIAAGMTGSEELTAHHDPLRRDYAAYAKKHGMTTSTYIRDVLVPSNTYTLKHTMLDKQIGDRTFEDMEDPIVLNPFAEARGEHKRICGLSEYLTKGADYIMSKCILTYQQKTERTYGYAIDILEGKIDETRLYMLK